LAHFAILIADRCTENTSMPGRFLSTAEGGARGRTLDDATQNKDKRWPRVMARHHQMYRWWDQGSFTLKQAGRRTPRHLTH
jgi:hypothetical protein